MVKEKQKKTAAKSSSRLSPPLKRQTRSETANNAAPDQTTSTNRQNATSAPRAKKTETKASEKETAANKTKSRSDSKPSQDGKPAESIEPQVVKNRKRKAEVKENDEDTKVSKKKQKLAKDSDANENHRKTGSRSDAQNANGSKSAATNPLLSTLNAATAQGERDLKATKRSYIRQNEEDSSAVPSHDGRFTPFPSGPPRSGEVDDGKTARAYRDELQKLELETRTRDSLAMESQPEKPDDHAIEGDIIAAEPAAKPPRHLSSSPDDEISHDEAAPSQPPNISSTTPEVGSHPAEPVATDGTSIRQAPETHITPVKNNHYPAILDMNPESALIHLDTLIQSLIVKVFASQDPNSTSLVCIKPSRELERLYRFVFGKDWKSATRHLHEQTSLSAAPLLRSLIWACLHKNILDSQLNVPWPSPHRTASLLETYFPHPDEEITALKHSVRKISLRFMKTEKFLREDLPLQTHSLVHTLYFSLVEHVHKVGGNWKGKDLWEICEAALLFKGICQASGEKAEVFWYGSGDEFDGEKMEREREGEGGEVALTVRPGLVGRHSEGGEEVCLVPARVLLVSEREDKETETAQ